MSLNARRLSRSQSTKKLLDRPKIRDKSKQPTIAIRHNGCYIDAIVTVGKIIYSVCAIFNEHCDKCRGKTFLRDTKFSYGTPVVILEIGPQIVKVLANIYVGDIFLKSITGFVMRTDVDTADIEFHIY